MSSAFTIKDYNDFPESELKSISLISNNYKEEQQDIYLGNKSLYVNGTDIIFVKKISPCKFKFKLDKTDEKKYKHFLGFIRHLTDSLSKKISDKSKDLIGKHLGKKKIKKIIFRPFIDKDDNIVVHMHDIIRSVRGNKGDADKILGTTILDKNIPIVGVSTKSFSSKFKRGTVFRPQYLLDYINVDYKSVNLVVSLIKLDVISQQHDSVPVKKKIVYHYSDDDDSDQDYLENEVDKKEVDKKEVDKKEVDKKEVDKKEVDKKEGKTSKKINKEEIESEEEGSEYSSGSEYESDEEYDDDN
jgi:hypothetical protein